MDWEEYIHRVEVAAREREIACTCGRLCGYRDDPWTEYYYEEDGTLLCARCAGMIPPPFPPHAGGMRGAEEEEQEVC